MEGDKRGAMWIPRMWISTHALTWRATFYKSNICPISIVISTHALTWRATDFAHVQLAVHPFLPTPSHGGRPRQMCQTQVMMDFYPRPHMEGDCENGIIRMNSKEFLPTPSHGGRPPIYGRDGSFLRDFYPRPHMEGDQGAAGIGRQAPISTHALTWRATPSASSSTSTSVAISTHALTWRATPSLTFVPDASEISTHALTWRATTTSTVPSLLSAHFYPRPHMEGDKQGRKRY